MQGRCRGDVGRSGREQAVAHQVAQRGLEDPDGDLPTVALSAQAVDERLGALGLQLERLALLPQALLHVDALGVLLAQREHLG